MMTSSAVFFVFLLLTLLLITASSDLYDDRNALIAFITSINVTHSKYKWDKYPSSSGPCEWAGVECGPENVAVVRLSIPGASLLGSIREGTLGKITSLRVLSLRHNGLSGPLPPDFAHLTELRKVILNNNNFSGVELSSSVANWTNLKILDVSNNNFTGTIPSTTNFNRIIHFNLSNNNFSGILPDSFPSTLKSENFSVSNNNLSGPIPSTLASFPLFAFSNNFDLCDKPLSKTCDKRKYPPPPPPSKKKPKKLSTGAIVAIAVGSALILLILLLCLGNKLSRALKEKKEPVVATMAAEAAAKAKNERGSGGGVEAGTSSSKDDVTGASAEGERNKLVFFEGGIYSFDLEDLLRASAEVLGKGSVGTSYKAVLEEGTTVVVKRLKDVVVSKKEFDGVMEGLGKMKNENVVPIRAYYYSKDEKLLVCDYFPAGSLSALLHGSRGSGRTPLDWDHRLRIALSAAKGVAYLHVAGKVVHGNIKSSNILLRQDSNKDASVSDFGLNTLFGGTSSPNTRVTGYRAPEVLESRKVTFKSDVYSFGVLLLELLTGKAPNQASLGEEGIDLPRWVQSVVREEWTAEVFDVELMRYQNIEEEMVQLLQIAMACVSTVPDQRPAMQEVVRMMEDMNRAETDDGLRQSSDDPSKGSDGHTPPTESRNSPNTVTP